MERMHGGTAKNGVNVLPLPKGERGEIVPGGGVA